MSDVAAIWRSFIDAPFFADQLGIAPDPWQAKVLASRSKRLLLNCSRQAGKSTVASVMGLHRAMHHKQSLVLLISPSLRQSAELFRKVLDLLDRLDERPALDEENKLSLKLSNGSRIVSLPSSPETIRGFSAVDLVIEDEASQVDDLLYRAVRPMLAVSNGRLVLMSTPYGKRGHFYEEWVNGGEVWERTSIRGDQNPRVSAAFLAEERVSMGEVFYSQEYECLFRDTTSQVFGSDHIEAAFDRRVEALAL